MKSNKSYLKLLLATTLAAVAMSGCGGGGGGGGGGSGSDDDSAGGSNATEDIVGTVPEPTYTAGSHIAQAFAYLNAQRQECGFGLLAQNDDLDQAAQAHANYIRTNNLALTHFENQTTHPTGYTGDYPRDRMIAAGYSPATDAGSENIGGANVTYGTTYGQASIMSLFAGPYHGYGQLRGDRDVGFGFHQTGGDPNTNLLVLNFARKAGTDPQDFASGAVKTYPCAGSTGVLSQSYATESPSPIAGRDIGAGANPIGTPIYFRAREGSVLAISSIDVRKQGSATPVATQQLKNSNDANNIIQDDSFIAVMPLSPLDKSATYVVSATGTVDGTAFSRNFTFQTGAF